MTGGIPTLTVLQYARDLFQDSLITGVPQILITRHTLHKVIKSIVLASCLFGFVYQTTEFLHIFWNYPTVLDIKVEYPNIIESPAITFCNLNGIKRKDFCKKHPDLCITPRKGSQICITNPEFCDGRKVWKFPNREALYLELNPMYLKEFGHSREETLVHCVPVAEEALQRFECRFNNSIVTLMSSKNSGLRTCHTIFSNIATNTLNQHSLPVTQMSQVLYHLVFEIAPEQYFRPDREVGVIVAVHSPNILVNPFIDGFVMKPGNFYTVHLKIVEEKLLPSPYETRCQDYKAMWYARGGKGPLSQEMCIGECIYNASMKECNCVLSELIYPHTDRICDEEEAEECFHYNTSDCYKKCQQPCEFLEFEFKSHGRKIESDINPVEEKESGVSKSLESRSVLALILKRPEKIIYSHRPQYEDIEVFSFIGGYVGMWLGISLVGVFDFFERIFLIVCFWIQKKLR